MTGLFWTAGLALLWVAVTGNVSGPNLVLGLLIGAAVVYLMRNLIGVPRYLVKLRQALSFAAYFAWELVKANARVVADVATPGQDVHPAILAVPLDARTNAEITLLAALITLTPGSTAIDVSADRRLLYVHVAYAYDVERERRHLKDGERRLLELLR